MGVSAVGGRLSSAENQTAVMFGLPVACTNTVYFRHSIHHPRLGAGGGPQVDVFQFVVVIRRRL
jgi:hypothetical protein